MNEKTPASDAIDRFADCTEKSMFVGTLRSLVFSSPRGGDCLKIRGTLRLIASKRVLQLECAYTEGRVTHENVAPESIAETIRRCFPAQFSHLDLADESGNASLLASKRGKITAVIPAALRAALDSAPSAMLATTMERLQSNDRVKNRLLSGKEPFLFALGIADASGRIHDKRQAKFRQICRFSEIVMESLAHLPKDKPLYIADLCSGKSYLSFAVYHTLREIAGREIEMVCVDLKKSVIDFCADTAKRLGYSDMHFLCEDITSFTPKRAPDMVISLHACDTATDVVLDFAMRHRAAVILSTPCCQRDLSRRLDCPTLSFIADRGALRRKFCDAATDALRLSRLECMGYTADALEFIDPEDTPKNIMLRAYRKSSFRPDSASILKKRADYAAAYRFLCQSDPPSFPEINTRHVAAHTEVTMDKDKLLSIISDPSCAPDERLSALSEIACAIQRGEIQPDADGS